MSTTPINNSSSSKGSKNGKYNRLSLLAAVAAGAITVEAANLLLSSGGDDATPITPEEVQEFTDANPAPSNSNSTNPESATEDVIAQVDPSEITLEESSEGEEDVVDAEEPEEIEIPMEDVEPYAPFANNDAINEDVAVDEVLLAENNEDMIADDVVDMICGVPAENQEDVPVDSIMPEDDFLADNESAISGDDIQCDLMG